MKRATTLAGVGFFCVAWCAALLAAEPAKDAPAQATATDDWYCPGYNAAHTYTSKDVLPPPLKLKWSWSCPKGKVYQVLYSGGKVFVKGRHPNTTPVGERNGVHNFVLDPETGKLEAEDPEGTSPNDFCDGWAGGTFGGKIYQADDGGPPFCGADVWGNVDIDPEQKMWVVVQHRRIDGPSPGTYCMPLGQGIWGKKWWVGHEVTIKDMKQYCTGESAIGPGAVYVAIQWNIKETQQKSGLLCFDLQTGKERWHVAGEFHGVSAGKDFCVAVDKQKVLSGYGTQDGKVLWSLPLGAELECAPMVVGDLVRVYDVSGTLMAMQIVEKDGKFSVKPSGQPVPLGKYMGPRVMGKHNACFCYSADGTLYVANGPSVFGVKPGPGARPWQWVPPPDQAKAAANLGNPIIAHGMLFAVSSTGVVCFEPDTSKKDEGPKRVPLIP
jgi:outer membrane protein assembly factor BamB